MRGKSIFSYLVFCGGGLSFGGGRNYTVFFRFLPGTLDRSLIQKIAWNGVFLFHQRITFPRCRPCVLLRAPSIIQFQLTSILAPLWPPLVTSLAPFASISGAWTFYVYVPRRGTHLLSACTSPGCALSIYFVEVHTF